jgi:hypothetical protein
VLFTALTKYDGNRVRTLRAREFHQIAGRAGRAGFDTAGFVVAQAPEHVIENEKALAKAGDDPKKRRKVVRKKAPEGFVGWTENTFDKLIASEPEPLTSRFRVTHTMLLSVIARPGNAFAAMRHLLEDNHEPRKQQLRHIRRAIAIYRSLLDGGIVERLDELLSHAYDLYRRSHPWVGDHPLSPKSVIRDMYERAMTFTEFVSFYELARTEGIVLRYLASAYKALDHTVPDDLKSEDFEDIIAWLGEMVRQVDSSLIDEWEELRNPSSDPSAPVTPAAPPRLTANVRAFRVLVRNAMFRRVELFALERSEDLGALDGGSGWDAAAWDDAMDGYFEEYDSVGVGPEARGPALLSIGTGPSVWTVRQTFDDPAGDRDWGISAEVDLAASDEAGEAVVRVTAVGPLAG